MHIGFVQNLHPASFDKEMQDEMQAKHCPVSKELTISLLNEVRLPGKASIFVVTGGLNLSRWGKGSKQPKSYYGWTLLATQNTELQQETAYFLSVNEAKLIQYSSVSITSGLMVRKKIEKRTQYHFLGKPAPQFFSE